MVGVTAVAKNTSQLPHGPLQPCPDTNNWTVEPVLQRRRSPTALSHTP